MAIRKPVPHRRIVRKPGVCGGEPIIQGTRIPVSCIVAEYQNDPDLTAVQRAYPRLDIPTIEEALAYYQAHREEIDRLISENERIAYSADPD